MSMVGNHTVNTNSVKEKIMTSNILIWNENIGFIRIAEGTGDNLLHEDEELGYVDYIMVDFIEYDGYEFTETDGIQVMLTELYQTQFSTKEEVVKFLIENDHIPEAEYTYLYGGVE